MEAQRKGSGIRTNPEAGGERQLSRTSNRPQCTSACNHMSGRYPVAAQHQMDPGKLTRFKVAFNISSGFPSVARPGWCVFSMPSHDANAAHQSSDCAMVTRVNAVETSDSLGINKIKTRG